MICFRKTESFVDLKVGDPLHLDCRAFGAPGPRITWYKDGQKIIESKDEEEPKGFQFPGWGLISLKSVDKLVGPGQYTCIAENEYGKS